MNLEKGGRGAIERMVEAFMDSRLDRRCAII